MGRSTKHFTIVSQNAMQRYIALRPNKLFHSLRHFRTENRIVFCVNTLKA